jgi:hypothetical protein
MGSWLVPTKTQNQRRSPFQPPTFFGNTQLSMNCRMFKIKYLHPTLRHHLPLVTHQIKGMQMQEMRKSKHANPVSIATLTYSKTMCFVPPLFITKQLFNGVPNDPLGLLLAVKAAAINFSNTHSSVANFKNDDATVQAKRFLLWVFAVFKGLSICHADEFVQSQFSDGRFYTN